MTTEITHLVDRKVLKKAKQYLLDHGWSKHSFRRGGSVCAAAAVAAVQGVAEQYASDLNAPHLDTLPGIELLNAAVEILGPRECGDAWHPVAKFNDAEETTFEDVVALFDKAIELAGTSDT